MIFRSGPASVEEMRWWLDTLPDDSEAVILENSAVDPDLQPLAVRWFRPQCFVLTNVRPDHEEIWGRGEESAVRALCRGIAGGTVVLPRSVAEKSLVKDLLSEKGCDLLPCDDGASFRETHLFLVGSVCRFFGFDPEKGVAFASQIPPDVADFRICREGEGLLAAAFSANDPESTEALFCSTGWRREATTLLFNARKDRFARLESFLPWFRAFSWKSVLLTGSRPLFLPHPLQYFSLSDAASLKNFIRSEERVFGCGNVAGIPLEYLCALRDDRVERKAKYRDGA